MGVVTLIVIGFTQLSIRNREDALDKQLSTQALYAAEAGVNDAISAMRQIYAVNPAADFTPKTQCNDPTSMYNSPQGNNLSDSVSYSCVLVTPNAPIIYTAASISAGSVVRIDPVNAGGAPCNLNRLWIEWEPSVDIATLPVSGCAPQGSTTYPETLADVCPYGLLRMDLYRQPASGGVTSPDALNTNTETIYMLPTRGAADPLVTPNFADTAVRAHRALTRCNDEKCYTTVMLNDASHFTYYARFSSMYYDIDSVTVRGQLSTSGTAAFKGQTLIDSTGKAQDVLRRIQVQVPVEGSLESALPNSAIHSTADFCKRFVVGSGYYRSECS